MHWFLPCLVAGVLGGATGTLTAGALSRAARPAPVSVGVCAAGTALVWVLTCLRWAAGGVPGWWLPLPLLATALAVPLSAADLRHRRLPDVLTLPAYPAAALAVATAAVAGPGAGVPGAAATGAGLFLGAHALVRALRPSGLGAGDVKLSGSLGGLLGVLGWPALVLVPVVAAVGTGVLAGAARLTGGSRPAGVPHGPGLLAATCLVLLFPGTAVDGVA